MGQFIESPQNKTVKLGDIAEFTCHVPDCTNSILQLLINGTINIEDQRLSLDQREYGFTINCEETESGGEHVALFWMFVNNRTLQAVRYVTCKFIDLDDGNVSLSDRAYIHHLSNTTTMNDEETKNNTYICANTTEIFNKAQTVMFNPLCFFVVCIPYYIVNIVINFL